MKQAAAQILTIDGMKFDNPSRKSIFILDTLVDVITGAEEEIEAIEPDSVPVIHEALIKIKKKRHSLVCQQMNTS